MRLKDYLEKHGVKANHFAKQIGITKTSMNNYLNRGTMPALDVAICIVKLTMGAVSYEDLIPKPEVVKMMQERKKASPLRCKYDF